MSESKSEGSAIKIDPLVLLMYIFRFWYLVLIGLVISLAISFYKMRYESPTYSVSSRLLVKDEYSSWGQDYFIKGTDLVSSGSNMMNEFGIIKSLPLMEDVVGELNWNVFYYKVGNVRTTEMYPVSEITLRNYQDFSGSFFIEIREDLKSRVGRSMESLEGTSFLPLEELVFQNKPFKIGVLLKKFKPDGSQVYRITVVNTSDVANSLKSKLRLTLENKEATILLFSSSGQTPAKEMDFLNQLMQVYIDRGLDINNAIARNTIAFVDEQLREVTDSLKSLERKIVSFQNLAIQDNVPLDDGIKYEELYKIEKNINSINLQQSYYELLEDFLKSDSLDYGIPSPQFFNILDPFVQDMVKELRVILLAQARQGENPFCLLYTSPSPRD